ncbi:hypothetical protein N9345_01265 [Candidatus Thioglobus sp.]|nr:hypothetical protein [Candidatus Thioglobus sp.]MDB3892800.1 hypothetical protein [Candidatus Thioglobus sp.]MDC0407538.1 hypothetical protein [Candidatus Thioglobus sp.]MDC0904804.1 hypothetical protein [Candidatus Thioglobus sp.]MDC0919855.1 hypothetical protein [Candidatus Thioglobus sp.]
MNLLFIISQEHGADLLLPLSDACTRQKKQYSCFFTGAGVKVLENEKIKQNLTIVENSVACHHSWDRYHPNTTSAATMGSQTNLSEMIANHDKVVSI